MSIWMQNLGPAVFQRSRTVIVNKSPFNAAAYRSGLSDDVWQFRFDYDEMPRDLAAPLLGAIAGQRGGTGAMLVFDPDWMMPGDGTRGLVATGTVAGAGQSGTSLVTNWSGATAGALIASPGDKLWIEDPVIGYKMYEVVAPALAISGGNATILLDVPMRAPPPNGVVVGTRWGTNGVYMTARMSGFEKSSVAGGLFRISVAGEEIVP